MIDKLLIKVYLTVTGILGGRRLRRRGVVLGSGVRTLGLPIVILQSEAKVEIGDRVKLCSTSYRNEIGVNHPVILRTSRPGATVVIGDDVGLSGVSICAADRIRIGAGSLLGANVIVVDSDLHPVAAENRRYDRDPDAIGSAPVEIGPNVFVGANSIVLKGVTIGANSVIGAGSVVTEDIPADCIAGGNPCRVIRPLP